MEHLKNWTRCCRRDGTVYYETENESGTFHCDETGLLLDFYRSSANALYSAPDGWRHDGLRNLILPEGITRIGLNNFSPDRFSRQVPDFRGLAIIGKLRLPASLKVIGSSVFSDGLIGDLEIPATLQAIEAGALMCCYIHVLRLHPQLSRPAHMSATGMDYGEGLLIHGRQFKEAMIDTLILPEGYPHSFLMPEARIRNICCETQSPQKGGSLWKQH